jgi:transmembrane sensor
MDRQDQDAEAIEWLMLLRDGGSGEDWLAFTDWLEADPANLAAYEAAERADEQLGALKPPEPPERLPTPLPRPSLPTRRLVLVGGMAAALGSVVALSTLRTSEAPTYAVETQAGERRSVELADGSRIDLNGATRILLDRADARSARIERGEALFTVVHDERDPFEVLAGEARILDLGTVFNVVHANERLQVGVAEGAVSYLQSGRRIELQPGMTLRVTGGTSAEVVRGEAADIAAWRDGRLVYRAAPIAHVAADLSRTTGVPVEAAPQVAARPFTGVINIDPGSETIQRAAALLGVGAARRGDGLWILTPGISETH